MAQQRKRDQKGSVFIQNGKVYVRYMEHQRDGTDRRASKLLGTKVHLNTKGKIRTACEDFMRTVNTAAEVTYWETLCDDYQKRGLDVRPSTENTTYAVLIRKLSRAFEGDRVDWLASLPGRMKMEDWLNNAEMSKKYRQLLRAMLTQIFEHGRRSDMLKGENPASLLKLKHRTQTTRPARKRNVITPAQFVTLMRDPLLPQLGKVVLALEVYTGLRGCEALGLQWSDIDWDGEPKIWIRRSVKMRYVEAPKTEASIRTVALPEKLARLLLRWRAESVQVGDWVFGSTTSKRKGLPWDYHTVLNYVKAAAKRAGFDTIGFGLHNPRHTFRRSMKRTGASLEDQGAAMGHGPKNLEQTLQYGAENDNAAALAPYVEKAVEMYDWENPLICHLTATSKNQVVENEGDRRQFNMSPIDATVENKGFGVIRGKRKTA